MKVIEFYGEQALDDFPNIFYVYEETQSYFFIIEYSYLYKTDSWQSYTIDSLFVKIIDEL